MFVCLSLTTWAQKYKKGFTYLEKGDLSAAVTTFEALLGSTTDAPPAMMGLAKIYSNKKYEGYSLETAYEQICKAMDAFKKLDIKLRNKLQDDDKGAMDMGKVQRDIITAAYEEAKKINTAAAYGNFLNRYTQAMKPQVETATKMRDLRGVEEAEKTGTLKAFEDWYRQCHPTALKFAPDVAIRGQKGLFEAYMREKSWSSYAQFAATYPENVYVKDSVAAKSFVPSAIKHDINGYRDFLKHHANSQFVKLAVDGLYELILQHNNIEECDFFVRNYANHPKAGDIWKVLYKAYIDGNGINSVFKFEETYPNFPFKDQLEKDKAAARKQGEAPIFEKTRASRDFRDFLHFAQHYAGSPYFPELEKPMFEALQVNRNLEACETFAQLYPASSNTQTVLEWVFDYYSRDGEIGTLDLFEQRYPTYNNNARLLAERKLAMKALEAHPELPFDSNRRTLYEEYIQAAAPRWLAFVVLQRYIERDIEGNNWDAALAKVERFKPFFGDNNREIEGLITALKAPLTAEKIERKAFEPTINTTSSEYVPLMSADENTLYFCRWDLYKMNEDIYASQRKDGVWQKAEPLTDLNSEYSNEGPMTLSADGNLMVIFVEGNLYVTERTAKGWSPRQPLPDAINSQYWDADAVFTADGRALIFTSRRPGGNNIYREKWGMYRGDNYGDCDLYVCTKNDDGTWNTAINLGTTINTPFAERTPFLHYDMKTLYFSSDGHGSFGRMDVYKAERLDDTWTNWSQPVNLGKEVNTITNDWGYKISTDGERVYYAAARNNKAGQDQNLDIFQMTLPAKARPDKVCTVSGTITDINNQPVAAQVVWEDLATGQKMGELKTNPQNGQFFIVIPEGKQYSYYISKEGHFPQADNIDLREQHCPVDIKKDIQLIKIQEMAEQEIAFSLKNLFFDFNKYEIKPESYPELNRLVEMVQLANKYNLSLEISGHTDHVGSDKDNVTLSRNRANAVRTYLIGKGCDANKIKAEGFGESKPIDTNETDAGRANNRRVEVRFVKKG